MKSFLPLFLLPLVALAGTPDDGPPEIPPQEPPSWENVLKQNQDVDVGAEAKASADASANVGDTTASIGDTTAVGGSVGDINVTGGGVNIHNPRQVASAYAPAVFPTAICEGGQSIGVQTRKWGVSWTRSESRREACLFALSQQWMSMGEYELACMALMATRSASYAYGEKKPPCENRRGPAPQGFAQAPQPTVIVVPITNGDPERIERIFKQLSEK